MKREHLKLHSVSDNVVSSRDIEDEVEDALTEAFEDDGDVSSVFDGADQADSEDETAEDDDEGEYDAGRDKTPEQKMTEADDYVIRLGQIPDEKLMDWLHGLRNIDDVRADCNERAKKIRDTAKDMGIASVDLNAIYARFKMEPWDRKKRDAAIQRGNKAMKEQTTFDFGK